MKKTLLLFVALFTATIAFAYNTKIDGIYYNLNDETQTAEVTYQYRWDENNYSGVTSITIPEKVTYNSTEYSVTSIGEWAFSYCSSLASISIPNSVTSIGEEAFYKCSSLTSITIPNSVTSIGDYTFYFCSSLRSIIISNNVTSIGNFAFYDCDALTSITIPNSVTSIGNFAFSGCKDLTSITIPNSVTYIGEGAFKECSLSSIDVEANNQNYASFDGVLYKKDITTLICCPRSKRSITIPNSVIYIEDYAFYSCSSLRSIIISNNVTSIGNFAFYDCDALTSITIPNSVTSIGNWAFSNCKALTSISIGNSVTSIGNYAFNNTLWLNNQRYGCVYIDNYLYTYKGNMPENTHIDIKEGTTIICDGTFFDCKALTSITIPNSVTSIGEEAFYKCSSLTSITIPNSVTSIGGSAFYFCSSLRSIIISNNVTSIGDYAFSGCKDLTSITIPNSVTSIGNFAFASCKTLTSITIPNSVTSIGNYAFSSCKALTSISIGNSVTSIGDYAFYNCSFLTSITCLGSTPPEANYLDTDTKNCILIVPKIAYSSYFHHAYWGQFLNIETIDVDYKKLTAIANNAEWGVVEGGDYYNNGDEATLTATANNGYRFVKWSDEVTDNPRTIVVTQDSTFTAIFEVAGTDLETSKISSANIYTTNGTLHIEGATGNYHILDAAGRLIYSGNATTLQLPRGIYLVTINGEVEKIVL